MLEAGEGHRERGNAQSQHRKRQAGLKSALKLTLTHLPGQAVALTQAFAHLDSTGGQVPRTQPGLTV